MFLVSHTSAVIPLSLIVSRQIERVLMAVALTDLSFAYSSGSLSTLILARRHLNKKTIEDSKNHSFFPH